MGLVVILYEEVARSIRRAQKFAEEKNIEEKTHSLSHALEVIGHLQATLDFERGGVVAKNLSRFYTEMRGKIVVCNARTDTSAMEELAQEFYSFAQAWRQVDLAIAQAGSAGLEKITTGKAPAGSYIESHGMLAET